MRIPRVREIPHAPSCNGMAGQLVGRTAAGFVVKTLDSTIEVVECDYDGKVAMGDRFE